LLRLALRGALAGVEVRALERLRALLGEGRRERAIGLREGARGAERDAEDAERAHAAGIERHRHERGDRMDRREMLRAHREAGGGVLGRLDERPAPVAEPALDAA